MTTTNEKVDPLSLVWEKGLSSFVTPISKSSRTKDKRNKKRWGYIRRKRINKKNYYYYTWTELGPGGNEFEKSEYLGTAEHIREKVKGS